MIKDFRINYTEIIEKFFSLFESIPQYMEDLEAFIRKVLWEDFFNPKDLTDIEMLTLLCESTLNAGVIFALIDRLIPGNTTEKLFLFYYRYKGQSTISTYTRYLWIIC